MSSPKVFLDIMIGKARTGRVIMELFADVTPKTAETSVASALVRNGIGNLANACTTRALSFTRLSQISCAKVGISTRGNGTGGESVYAGILRTKLRKKMHRAGNPFDG